MVSSIRRRYVGLVETELFPERLVRTAHVQQNVYVFISSPELSTRVIVLVRTLVNIAIGLATT